MSKEFKEVNFEGACPTLSWSFHTRADENNDPRPEILRIMFHGKYREGQEAHTDAHLITVIIAAAVNFWHPKFVIIDLSDFEYHGGDEFEKIYDSVDDDDIQTVVLVGDKSRAAMTALYYGTEEGKDIVDNNFFYDDLDKAIKKLKDQE